MAGPTTIVLYRPWVLGTCHIVVKAVNSKTCKLLLNHSKANSMFSSPTKSWQRNQNWITHDQLYSVLGSTSEPFSNIDPWRFPSVDGGSTLAHCYPPVPFKLLPNEIFMRRALESGHVRPELVSFSEKLWLRKPTNFRDGIRFMDVAFEWFRKELSLTQIA